MMGRPSTIDLPDLGTALDRERRLDWLLSHDVDLDWERERAQRYRFVRDRGRIRRAVLDGPGSLYTATPTDVLYSNSKAGTAKNTFTTEAQINDTAGMGTQAKVPAVTMFENTTRTATIRVVGRGIVSSTATPTFTWTNRFVSTAGVIIAGTAALTTASGISNKGWEMEYDMQVTIMAAAGNNSTVRSSGFLVSPAGLASPFNYEVWGNAAQPGTVATVDVTIDNLFFWDAACNTSSVSNGITLLQLIIMGLT